MISSNDNCYFNSMRKTLKIQINDKISIKTVVSVGHMTRQMKGRKCKTVIMCQWGRGLKIDQTKASHDI